MKKNEVSWELYYPSCPFLKRALVYSEFPGCRIAIGENAEPDESWYIRKITVEEY